MSVLEPFSGDELELLYVLLEKSKADCRSALQHPAPGLDPARVKYTQSVARSAFRKIARALRALGIDPESIPLDTN